MYLPVGHNKKDVLAYFLLKITVLSRNPKAKLPFAQSV